MILLHFICEKGDTKELDILEIASVAWSSEALSTVFYAGASVLSCLLPREESLTLRPQTFSAAALSLPLRTE